MLISLDSKMASLTDLTDGLRIENNAELLQQIALLAYLDKNSEGAELLSNVTQARVGYELFQRVTGQDQIDKYKKECILAIADYCKKHPNASKEDLRKEVGKQIVIFAARVDAL
ncbi:Hypp2314 [Branchiostoma lanceolatum]|uniref:Hypp2314 protein n=2 Tax=Branchiostoma lanceolatum TaxID=7740 RepID=A0A8J9ZPW9_BRALA|nr:Hypp2314 [Branchiostoma lanceolatum]